MKVINTTRIRTSMKFEELLRAFLPKPKFNDKNSYLEISKLILPYIRLKEKVIPAEILKLGNELNRNLSKSTVYKTFKLLKRLGLIRFEDGYYKLSKELFSMGRRLYSYGKHSYEKQLDKESELLKELLEE